jgi:hypothetical protein
MIKSFRQGTIWRRPVMQDDNSLRDKLTVAAALPLHPTRPLAIENLPDQLQNKWSFT